VHHAVVIDRLDTYPRPESIGSRPQYDPSLHSFRLVSIGKPGPVQPIVTFAIEISSKVDHHVNHLRQAVRSTRS
jgi:hypothetical protein